MWDDLLIKSWQIAVQLGPFAAQAYGAAAQWRDWADANELDAIRVAEVIAPIVKPALDNDFVAQFFEVSPKSSFTMRLLWNWQAETPRSFGSSAEAL